MKKLLLKASEEHDVFYDLIGAEVTFATDIIDNSGAISNLKGEKAIISEVEYVPGYWSRLCSDIYVPASISTFKINNMSYCSWMPNTFEEYRNHKT